MRALLVFLMALPAMADTGSAVCARCHPAIARQYAQTGMAQSSGRVGQSPFKEKFGDPRVTPGYLLQIGDAARQLEYFLGSGHIGRSYLFRKGRELFQAPLSYYSATGNWDSSPGYESKTYTEFTRTVEPACLQCHTSPGRPFAEPGITCERCHGAGEPHAAQPTKRNIVNPAKLPAERRDSICAQCHLTGAARVARAGRERGTFRPGDRLSDSIAVFMQDATAVSATSHFEKLAASRCKQASGDRLWCGTCHTPHADSNPAHYRQQCQTCHAAGACKANAGEDCVRCHMPKRSGPQSISHLAFTDHAIPRRPPGASAAPVAGPLKEFWTGTATPRDTAMAYAAAGRDEAYPLLQEAVKTGSTDVSLLVQLAQYHERFGKDEAASALYNQILRLDPNHPVAAINLGTFQIRQGKAKEAMALWTRALLRNPAMVGARLNLAVAQYQNGDAAAARRSLELALEYEPEHPAARRMLAQLPQ